MADEEQDEELDDEVGEVDDEALPPEVKAGAQLPSRADTRSVPTDQPEEPQKPAQEQKAPVAAPATVMVDGKEIPLDEVVTAYRQRGSQQQDYQKKTSELADQRRQLERALGQRLAGASDQAPSREAPPAQPAVRTEARTPADDVVSMMGELLLDKEIREVREAYGDIDEDALVEIMAETRLSGKEAYIQLVGRNALRQNNQATAETTARGLLNRSRVAEGSSSRLAPTTQPMTPDEAGKKSWAALAEEGRSDLQRRGGKILSSE